MDWQGAQEEPEGTPKGSEGGMDLALSGTKQDSALNPLLLQRLLPTSLSQELGQRHYGLSISSSSSRSSSCSWKGELGTRNYPEPLMKTLVAWEPPEVPRGGP